MSTTGLPLGDRNTRRAAICRIVRGAAKDLFIQLSGSYQAAARNASIRPSQPAIRFQLAMFWSTTLRSLELERATGGKPPFAMNSSHVGPNVLTPQHNTNSHRWANELRTGWSELPLQLMAQMYTPLVTVADVIHLAPNYYAQWVPRELSHFDWVIDPRDLAPTAANG